MVSEARLNELRRVIERAFPGESQRKVAGYLGVKQGTLSRVLSGKRSGVRVMKVVEKKLGLGGHDE